MTLQLINPGGGLATGGYIVKRYDVRKTITFPTQYSVNPYIWGRGVNATVGWSAANPNYQTGYCNVVWVNSTQAQLQTFVYQFFNGLGQSVGWYPSTVGNAAFAYSILGAPLSGPPTTPQNPALSSSIPGGYGFVKFSWTANSEPDLQYYEVWRKVIEYGGNWTLLATTTNPYYIDNEFLYTNPVGDFRLTYKVRVKDNQNLYSIYSEEISCRAETASKKGSLLEGEVSDYNLFQNYPNPFNPQTTIQYNVKEKGLVQLKIFDILGKEVAVLVNEVKEEGNHYVIFDASDLPSGVYVYKLRVNNFISNQKMILLK
ncbi:MAG: T9SS type A sorting domain-containing protein [Ignavibacteria bacterium]|nr:T9SS type A sorting domain-containing protein [Ignavibacteria bacterium]